MVDCQVVLPTLSLLKAFLADLPSPPCNPWADMLSAVCLLWYGGVEACWGSSTNVRWASPVPLGHGRSWAMLILSILETAARDYKSHIQAGG